MADIFCCSKLKGMGKDVPASAEFDFGQGAGDGQELDVWCLFRFIY
jgi:hypothetical protein